MDETTTTTTTTAPDPGSRVDFITNADGSSTITLSAADGTLLGVATMIAASPHSWTLTQK
jgi:hypothetical protein